MNVSYGCYVKISQTVHFLTFSLSNFIPTSKRTEPTDLRYCIMVNTIQKTSQFFYASVPVALKKKRKKKDNINQCISTMLFMKQGPVSQSRNFS